MTAPASIFDETHFDHQEDSDTYVAEISELSHKIGTRNINRAITVCGRHYTFNKADRSGGDIAGWRYREISGTGEVLIIND